MAKKKSNEPVLTELRLPAETSAMIERIAKDSLCTPEQVINVMLAMSIYKHGK